jgi:predicted dehydrogenase
MLTLGVIGGGFAKSVVIPAALEIPELTVAGICTRTPEKAAETAKQFSIPYQTTDWRKILDQKFDLYYVGVPPLVQEDILEELVKLKTPFLCEKPLGVDISRLERIVEMAGPNSPSMIDFEFTQIPAWIEAKRLIEAGEIGDIESIDIEWKTMQYANKHRLESWKTRLQEGGGAINVFGTHSLHGLMWLGGTIDEIELKLLKKADDKRDTHTAALATLTFASGAAGSLSLDCESQSQPCHKVEIDGSKGSIRLWQDGSDVLGGFKLEVKNSSGARESDSDFHLAPGQDSRVAGVRQMLNLLLVRLRDPQTPGPDLVSALAVQRLIAGS